MLQEELEEGDCEDDDIAIHAVWTQARIEVSRLTQGAVDLSISRR